MTEYITPQEKQDLLEEGVVFGDFEFASGQRGASKFEFDLIQDELFRVAVRGLAACIADNFDQEDVMSIVTVGNGANRLGDPIVEELHKSGVFMFHIPARKDTNGNFYILPMHERDFGAVVVDDVYTSGSSLEKVKSNFENRTSDMFVRGRDKRVVGAAVLLNRSESKQPNLGEGLPVYSVMHHKLS